MVKNPGKTIYSGRRRTTTCQAPEIWMKEYCVSRGLNLNDYKKQNFIPLDIGLSFDNFDQFISARKELIKEKLLETLKS